MVPDSDTVVDGSNPKIFEEMDIYLYWRMKRRIRHKSAIKATWSPRDGLEGSRPSPIELITGVFS
ncbi:hypothetical protein OUZ56_016755 [Daphnia magna]|uniref:Uncharacterized protein n=1 Tax=Daphnia magna TaxID=35525 RepID=A0ABR0ARF9_9CRUS|nr:hypothetical protein OUZ56_016755 [Daphnia magna]